MKPEGSTFRLHLKLLFLSEVEVSGIPGVAVKCVEIRRNIGGEGGFWIAEGWGQAVRKYAVE